IGVEHYQYAKLYNGRIPRPDSGLHTVESTTGLLEWLGVRCEQPPPLRYEFHPKESARIQQRLRGRPYVVIHPASVMATKRWEACRFAEVGQALSEDGLTMVVTAGPGEGSLALQVAKDIQSTVVLLDLSIPELAELSRGAQPYIGNDSGPMHLAAAAGTPTVAVWRPSHSRRWRP